MEVKRRVFHYTTKVHLAMILADGYIRPATAYVARHEKPAAWFSENQVWEATSVKGIIGPDGWPRNLTKEEQHELAGLVRIEVRPEAAPLSWLAFVRKSGIRMEMARALEDIAYPQGSNPKEWRASFKPVGRKDWLAVEVWNGHEWEPDEAWAEQPIGWNLN